MACLALVLMIGGCHLVLPLGSGTDAGSTTDTGSGEAMDTAPSAEAMDLTPYTDVVVDATPCVLDASCVDTTGTVGTCRPSKDGPICCTGCWDSATCQPGTQLSACGLGGIDCQNCLGSLCQPPLCSNVGTCGFVLVTSLPCMDQEQPGMCVKSVCCTTCVTTKGVCHGTGTASAACGTAGAACQVCGSGQDCESFMCQ